MALVSGPHPQALPSIPESDAAQELYRGVLAGKGALPGKGSEVAGATTELVWPCSAVNNRELCSFRPVWVATSS